MSSSLQGTELERRERFARPRIPGGDIAAVDDGSAPSSATPHKNMDVRIIGIPMVDGHPVEAAAIQILGHVRHEIAGEGAKVAEIRCVLGADDQPEVMAVILAARRERVPVRRVARSIEHAGVASVAGPAIAPR
ncbi:MAG: hypothetical protein IPM41_06830 [Sphingomonadales bacterium]|nr:hypothetical protein [Sphingomonadales bacterium]